jgi:hypothetical protein
MPILASAVLYGVEILVEADVACVDMRQPVSQSAVVTHWLT